MKLYRIEFVLMALFLLPGCVTPAPEAIEEESIVIDFKEPSTLKPGVTEASALQLERSGRYLDALKQYSQLADTAIGRMANHRAMCGKARCLSHMGEHKLAISALAPLPLEPRKPYECEKLALAGELLLRMNKYEEAESTLEVAIASLEGGDKSAYYYWLAPATANLGKAYLHNSKVGQAQIMFRRAAEYFAAMGNAVAAEKCRTVDQELQNL
jgi:tetratricopeptide (TPR) repeat protein